MPDINEDKVTCEMSKDPSKAYLIMLYSKGYMTGVYGSPLESSRIKNSLSKKSLDKGYSRGCEVRKMHREKLKHRSTTSCET